MLRLQTLVAFAKDEHGATAIEYGLIAAVVSVAALTAIKGVGTQLSTLFGKVSSNLAR